MLFFLRFPDKMGMSDWGKQDEVDGSSHKGIRVFATKFRLGWFPNRSDKVRMAGNVKKGYLLTILKTFSSSGTAGLL